MGRPKKRGRDIDGVVLLDKPQGISSNDLLQKVKRLFQANKAGHTGALDPLATGMLPICLGEATKFSQFLLDADKTYVVTAKLGERTDTSDAEGQVISTREVKCGLADIEQALPHFRGELMQVPTMFSALKHNGKPLYEYARAGITIAREARPITVFSLELLDYEAPFLRLNVHCSKGTYIRTLVDDLGKMLGCGAHVVVLRRIGVANYPQDKMLSLEQLQALSEQGASALDKVLLPTDSAVDTLPALMLDESQALRICQGQRLKLNVKMQPGQLLRLFSPQRQFLGVGRCDERQTLHPQRLITTH
ncbi:tRNA pseudouridine(55) synthase TruB [Pasteurellaceae bacterium HPA106]|uniref:tRNA pseudouridine(55) synthase TruB n=1 Tax=Spirabiliibacterium pneumoniae TaxID=221400 RepID=UPI001AACF8EE|nr:tRNA pseudouridine(55) synthase TruB [Spirabiliibacterium pneumoniae]MBE2895316.1 tRNA pseudouridine(55) synthase TruB [Spirabiliibacterium pneumoniae]